MPKTSISFRVPDQLWIPFKAQTEELFLNMAPFLDYAIRGELPHLHEDLASLSLSTKVKRHISGQVKRTGATSKNIEVRPETAEALRAATSEHNLVRDAFMCRLIIFLRSTDSLLKYLEVPEYADDHGVTAILEGMPTSPMRSLAAVRDDPLYYVRHHLQELHGCGIYQVALPRSMDWAACYLDDELVKGTRAHKKKQKEEEELFAMLDIPFGSDSKTTRSTR